MEVKCSCSCSSSSGVDGCVYTVLCAWSAGRYRAFKILSLTRARKDVLKPWHRTSGIWWLTGPEGGVRHCCEEGNVFTKNGLIGLIKVESMRLFTDVYIPIFIYLLIMYGLHSSMNTKNGNGAYSLNYYTIINTQFVH